MKPWVAFRTVLMLMFASMANAAPAGSMPAMLKASPFNRSWAHRVRSICPGGVKRDATSPCAITSPIAL